MSGLDLGHLWVIETRNGSRWNPITSRGMFTARKDAEKALKRL